ncbi:oligoendopeptidase, partial [Bacillus cereus]
MSYSLNWDLESIFPGGSHSDALNQRMKQLEDQTNEYYQRVTKWSPSSDNAEQLKAVLQLQETITNGFTQCNSYIT